MKNKILSQPGQMQVRSLLHREMGPTIPIESISEEIESLNDLNRNDMGSDSLFHLNKKDRPLDDQEALRQIADIWVSAALAMNVLLSQKQISYFQVIQPNQSYSTTRKLSEAEKKPGASARPWSVKRRLR